MRKRTRGKLSEVLICIAIILSALPGIMFFLYWASHPTLTQMELLLEWRKVLGLE